ncbi:hypothetical protein Hanom_Chr08g00747571 [Helianthus anomalus]
MCNDGKTTFCLSGPLKFYNFCCHFCEVEYDSVYIFILYHS